MDLPPDNSRFWPVFSGVCFVFSGLLALPFLAFYGYLGLMLLADRPQPFEKRVQLRGAAVYALGTKKQSWDGDYSESKFALEFQKTNGPREFVAQIERAGLGFHEEPLGKMAWFAFGDSFYLREADEIYSRHKTKTVWQYHRAHDGKNPWSLQRINPKTGRIVYVRTERKRRFERVYQLPQNGAELWALKADSAATAR